MAESDYIPVGRTSLVKKEDVSLQVQTEYASRPYPRVTTTILKRGEVVHKVEKKLNRTVESIEEQSRTEALIQQQHSDVLAIIQRDSTVENLRLVEDTEPENNNLTMYDRLTSIPGFQHLYRLSSDGAFIGQNTSDQFKKTFTAVFKHLREVIDIFALLPGSEVVRQKGVYEVERNRLYFVSAGNECFFVTVQPTGEQIDYEVVLQKALLGADLD